VKLLKRVAGYCLAVSVLTACTPTAHLPTSSAEIESVGILALQAHKQSAIDQLLRWAEMGYPVAQRELGLVYTKYANAQNPQPDAALWLQKAATAGDREAQKALAQAIRDGTLGLKPDNALAWKWFEEAAKQGDGQASFMLARMASHGQGPTRDNAQNLEQSAQWLQVAAKQKNAQAMYQLSVAYRNGEGIPQNIMLARYWLNMSAEHDYNIAIQALAMELDGLGGDGSPFAERSRHLFKEARDHRLMRWNTHL
jgi:uncharacterized protein